MDLADFDEFKRAIERLHRQTEDPARSGRRTRKPTAPLVPEGLAKTTDRLAKQAAALATVSRAKHALLLRRDRALKRAGRLSNSDWLK
ncbi:MAG: hypothetical protein WBW69_00755 [Candidatus Korobacteraceae bacterium]